MTRARTSPTPLAAVEVRQDATRWTLVFTRELNHPPAEVWRALTDPAELRQWAPFDSDRDLGRTGKATLTMAAAGGQMSDEALPAVIRRADRPTLLEYTWGDDLLRWELAPVGGGKGTRLTLSHTIDDRDFVPKVAAGWHVCLDVCEALLDGAPVGRTVADDAKKAGWDELRQGYEDRLG